MSGQASIAPLLCVTHRQSFSANCVKDIAQHNVVSKTQCSGGSHLRCTASRGVAGWLPPGHQARQRIVHLRSHIRGIQHCITEHLQRIADLQITCNNCGAPPARWSTPAGPCNCRLQVARWYLHDVLPLHLAGFTGAQQQRAPHFPLTLHPLIVPPLAVACGAAAAAHGAALVHLVPAPPQRAPSLGVQRGGMASQARAAGQMRGAEGGPLAKRRSPLVA